MGSNAKSSICYGIKFGEEYVFPWGEDIEGWWFKKICNYKRPFEIFDESGEFINGQEPSQDKMNEYWNHYHEFRRQNQMSIELVNYYSYDEPMYIISLPNNDFFFGEPGIPEVVDPSKLIVDGNAEKTIIDFCEKYCRPQNEYDTFPNMKPQFYMVSFYG